MHFTSVDWIILTAAAAVFLAIGLLVGRRAGQSAEGYFLGNRSLPWWLLGPSTLGPSTVLTAFALTAPSFVTGLVRREGVSGNWAWWAFVLSGMTTTFLFARLWRRSRALTDVEFCELRYSGKPAAFLRGFRGIYFGVIINVLILANLTLAAVKLGGVLFGVTPVQGVLLAATIALAYTLVGGLRVVILTNLVQLALAAAGSVWAVTFLIGLPEVGGLAKLVSHPVVAPKLALLPDFAEFHGDAIMAIFLFPLLIHWWSAAHPGGEAGGGGAVAQRLLAAKSEAHAVGASLFGNVLHYALRPWPWILVALASLIVFPPDPPEQTAAAQTAINRAGSPEKVDEATRLAARGVTSLRASFPGLPERQITHDLAYPALLTRLPTGLLGLVVTALIAAYASTLSSQLNWGASVVAHDVYRRFLNPAATERQMTGVGRLATLGLMAAAGLLATVFQDLPRALGPLIQVGAGSGLLLLLRWFWWRVNAAAELTALVVSFGLAAFFFGWQEAGGNPPSAVSQMMWGVGATTAAWVLVALVTQSTDEDKLREFYRRIQPGGPGWRYILERAEHERQQIRDPKMKSDLPIGLLATSAATAGIWALIFAGGFFLYGLPLSALGMLAITAVGGGIVGHCWKRLSFSAGTQP